MTPKISVVIGAYNEEKLLPRCLTALSNQTYPKDKYEIVLLDNGSTDQTAKIGKEFGAHVYKYAELQGIAVARQAAAERARGEILAFTDADSVVSKDWLEKIDRYLSDPDIVCVGGPGRADQPNKFQEIIYGFYDFFHLLNHMVGKPLMWGFNMAVKRDAYEAVGGVNKNLLASEDWDLAFRLQKRYGAKSIVYKRDLSVQTSPRKQNNLWILIRYTRDGISNYIDMVILGKPKSRPPFIVR